MIFLRNAGSLHSRWLSMSLEAQEYCNTLAEKFCDERLQLYKKQSKKCTFNVGDEVIVSCVFKYESV